MLTGLVALVTLEFLSARTQKQIFQHMIEEEKREFVEHPEVEKLEMRQYYVDEGFSGEEADSFVNRLSLDKDRWLKAHVTHVLEFIPGKTGSPGRESLTMGLSHILGATITLLPYLLLTSLDSAAYGSILLASVTLFAAGALKTRVAGGRWYVSGAEFLTLGMLAVIVGYLVGIAVADLA